MTHIRTATVELTVGLETLNTTVNQIIRLMLRAGFVPLILTQTSQTTNLKVSTWQIKFVHMQSLTLLILNWKWRKYSGSNPHTSHIHVSFNKGKADTDGSFFEIPMLGGTQ
jgi:hypothetical protein